MTGQDAYLDNLIQRQQERIEELERLATQRGARMQIMRDWMGTVWAVYDSPWREFLRDYPEAKDWFDGDGVPK